MSTIKHTEFSAEKRQLVGLTTLLTLEKEARHAPDVTSLGFIIVNESLRLFPYEQALFWITHNASDIKPITFSGVARFDSNAPQVLWLKEFIGHYLNNEASHQCHVLSGDQVDSSHSSRHVLWVPFNDPLNKGLLGGIWLTRNHVWEIGEQRLAQHLADGYSQALALLNARKKPSFFSFKFPHFIKMILVGGFLVGLLMFPVRQSVLAPATVVAQQPTLMTAPADGIIHSFHVVPNQTVEVGQPLFDLDPTDVNNRYQVALMELSVSKAHYQKAERKAFQNTQSGGELASLSALIARSNAQANHAKELLERLNVKSPVAGVAIFSDVNQWLGRPVRVGERILSIADPVNVEVEILLPVSDALVLEASAQTRLFLNTDPLHPLPGTVRYASYEANTTPEGVLAYRMRSTFATQSSKPRLGLKGTAKLFGKKVPLLLYLFRRPFSAFRQWTGL